MKEGPTQRGNLCHCQFRNRYLEVPQWGSQKAFALDIGLSFYEVVVKSYVGM